MSQSNLIISGGYLLASPSTAPLKDHGVAAEGDIIKEIGPVEDLKRKYPQAELLHSPGGLIMAGLINTHTHAAMACLRGVADDLPLMAWLQDHIFPIEAKLTPEIVKNSTLLSIAEMIRSGTTSFCDMYLFAKDVAEAAESSGIRSWIGEVLYDFPSPSYGELENGFPYMRELFERYENNPLINITVDPHSVYTCSPNLIRRLFDFSIEHNALYHVHLSENQNEVNDCIKQYGLTPVQHLHKLGVLSSGTLAAHCVVLDDTDIEILAENSVNVLHCIESNMKLGSGLSPVQTLLDNTINVSIGTDGSASNNDVDMFGEMSSVAKVHKGFHLDPTIVSAETTVKMATVNGAKALGSSKEIGSLEVGKKCDCIVIDMNQPHLIPCYNVTSHLTYAVRGGDVIHSVINGKVVMKNRELLTIDLEEVASEMNRFAAGVR